MDSKPSNSETWASQTELELRFTIRGSDRGIKGGVAFVTVIVACLLAPATFASPPMIKSPPTTSSTAFNSSSYHSVGCGSTSSSAFANTSTGNVYVRAEVLTNSSVSCAESGQVSATAGFLGPGFVQPTSGTFKIVYKWNVSWTAFATGGVSGGCTKVRLRGLLFGNLLDRTKGTWALGGSYRASQENFLIKRGTCPSSYSVSGSHKSIQFNASLSAGDTYEYYAGATAKVYLIANPSCPSGVCSQDPSQVVVASTVLSMTVS